MGIGLRRQSRLFGHPTAGGGCVPSRLARPGVGFAAEKTLNPGAGRGGPWAGVEATGEERQTASNQGGVDGEIYVTFLQSAGNSKFMPGAVP